MYEQRQRHRGQLASYWEQIGNKVKSQVETALQRRADWSRAKLERTPGFEQ